MFVEIDNGEIVEITGEDYKVSSYIRIMELKNSMPNFPIWVKLSDGNTKHIRAFQISSEFYRYVQINGGTGK